MSKGVLACLALWAAFLLPAKASETEVGAQILVVSGTHTEQFGVQAKANLVPAPVLTLAHRAGRWDFAAEALPPERAPIANNALGLNATTLSYMRGSMSYAVTPATSVGIGELIYNQQSDYRWVYPAGSNFETDRSRVAGADYLVAQTLRATTRAKLTATFLLAPSLHGRLGQQGGVQVVGSPPDIGPWHSTSESGNQLDAIVENAVQIHKRTTLHYGVRYLNMTMRFSGGFLADRNAFFVPFIGVSTTLR